MTAPALPAPGRHDAFVSYSHNDRELAVRLRDALASHGKEVWLDERSIPPAASWEQELERAIEAADAVVFLVSAASIQSTECMRELAHAASLNKKVIPVRAAALDLRDLPRELASRQLIPARGPIGDQFEDGVRLIVEALDTDLDWTREHTEWLRKALEWERHAHERSYLLGGAELVAAETWRTSAPGRRPEMTALHAEFIDASRRAATRRLRRARAFVTAALVVAVALAVVALVQRQAAVSAQHGAQARALVSEAAAALPSDPELALLLALRGQAVDDTTGGALVLRQAVAADQLRRVLVGHRGRVWGVAFDPADRNLLASAGRDRTVRLWNVATGRATVLAAGPAAGIGRRDLAFSPDGSLFAAGASDGTIRVWRTATRRPLGPVLRAPGNARVNSLQFIPGGILFVATAAGSAIWALPAPAPYSQTPPGTGEVLFASVTRDGGAIAFANRRDVTLVNDRKKIVLASGAVPTVAQFSPGGRRLVTALADGLTALWTTSGRLVAHLNAEPGVLGVSDTAFCAAFSADARLVAVGYDDGVVGVFGAGDGHVVEVIHSTRGPVRALNFGAGDDLAATGFDGATRVWDAYTGQQIDVLADEAAPVLATATTPDGRTLATAGADGRVRVWETLPGRLRYRAPSHTAFAALAPAGDAVVTVGTDDAVTLTRLGPRPASRRIGVFTGAGQVLPPTVSAGARIVVLLQGSRLIAVDTARERHVTLAGSTVPGSVAQPLRFASFDPGGTRVVAPAAGRRILVWNTATGAVETRLASHPAVVTDVRFSPDGRLVASTDASGRTEIQAADGSRAPVTLAGRTALADMAFSADGRLLATAASLAGAATVRLWDVRNGRALGAPAAGYGAVAAFSADGRWLATESATGSAAIFRVGPRGLAPRPRLLPAGVVTGVAFSASGDPLVADIRGISLYDRRTGALVGQFGGARAYYGFELAGTALLALAAPQGTPAAGADATDAATVYSCDACARPASLPRVARSLLVRGLTADETRRYVNGA